MNEKKNALVSLRNALEQFEVAWLDCVEAMSDSYIDANDYILGDKNDGTQYPFDMSFDEIGVDSWVNEAIRKIDTELEEM